MAITEPELRRCYRCKVEQPLTAFYVATETRRGKTLGRAGVVYPCRTCNREIGLIRRQPRVEITDQAKLTGCADCGLVNAEHPEIFDFDHRPGVVKVARVSSLLTKGTVEDLVAEIAKCDVVCANCHRIRTRSRENSAFGADWADR